MNPKPTYEELEKRIGALEKEADGHRQLEMRLFSLRSALLDNIPGCIALVIRKETREIVANNRHAGEMGAAPGMKCYKAFAGRDDACPFCRAPELWHTGRMQQLEIKYGGEWYEGIWTPLSEDLYVHYIFNISARKKAEAALKMASIGTLAGGIAHDFNNILYAVIGNAELALEDIPEWSPAYAFVEEIKAAGLRAADIVKHLLDFSHKADIEAGLVDVGAAVEDALKFLRTIIPDAVEVRKHFPDTGAAILADPVQINHVLMNLCMNAFHAMENTGGVLDIRVEHKGVTKSEARKHPGLFEGDYVKITFADTGPGIDAGIIERIFDPYFTTQSFGKQAGMGLTDAFGIVRSHGGVITADSPPGQGALFTILLPASARKPAATVEPSDEIPRGDESILFVDDDETITNMSEKILERLGYRVEIKTDPFEALARFQSNPDLFDLVITDMAMPGMTGVDLSENIRALRNDIPVIVCTGHNSLIDDKKARALGMAACVKKPIVMKEMARIIRRVLDEKER